PMTSFVAGPFKRQCPELAKCSTRGEAAARESRDQNVSPDTFLAHADSHAPHHVVHNLVALLLRLQRPEHSIGQCPLHLSLRATLGHTIPASLNVARCSRL